MRMCGGCLLHQHGALRGMRVGLRMCRRCSRSRVPNCDRDSDSNAHAISDSDGDAHVNCDRDTDNNSDTDW